MRELVAYSHRRRRRRSPRGKVKLNVPFNSPLHGRRRAMPQRPALENKAMRQEGPRRNRPHGRRNLRTLSDTLVLEVVSRFLDRHDVAKTASVQSVIEEVNQRFGEDLSREQAYPVFHEGLSRGFVSLNPPRHLSLSQRIMDRCRLKPACQQVIVVDVEAKPRTIQAAVELATAKVLKPIILELARRRRVRVGLGAGRAVLSCIRTLGNLLRSEDCGPAVFVVHPIEAPGYAAARPNTSAISFARLLEAPWNKVVIRPRREKMRGNLLILDAQQTGASDTLWSVDSQTLVLLAGPGDLEAVRPWFGEPCRFTHAIVDPKTAASLLEAE